MIEPFAAAAEIFGRGQPAVLLELMDQVRLIIEFAFVYQVQPIHRGVTLEEAERMLKPGDP